MAWWTECVEGLQVYFALALILYWLSCDQLYKEGKRRVSLVSSGESPRSPVGKLEAS